MKLLLCHLQVLSVSTEAVKLVYILVRGFLKNETVVVPFTSAQCEHRGCKACVYTSKKFPEE